MFLYKKRQTTSTEQEHRMKKRNILAVLVFCTSLIVSGCALVKPTDQTLAGTSWEVTGYHNGQSIASVINDAKTLTANFGTDGKMGGSAGCNSYSSPYTAEAATNSLVLGRIISTKMACSQDGIMRQEQQFLAALRTVAIYHIGGDTLILQTADGTVAIHLKKK
ncbi:MAG: META domain-containing protein [Candidatus Electrothrix sp. AR4]|nr:META domain-containing protein [Candidatus Electrothrix sp. AR4]